MQLRQLVRTVLILIAVMAEVQAEPLVISTDMKLDPAQQYGPLVIKSSNITIDGNGAQLVGSRSTDPSTFRDTAITAIGVSGVTIRNLSAKGWERGLHLVDGHHWRIEDCDFSDNYHAPSFGWGENGRRGGILLESIHSSLIRRCRANRVWDGCVLVDSNDNLLEHNDFSHTSNTCLKLWHATGNLVRNNQLTYGIRKDPGEVHARDSTCVLLESGSDRNRFVDNDCRYGGDGIFVRVLNGWVSSDNYFEGNDCSFANNNCIEAWSPRNTWVRNKANYGSYGFWLGASDKNVLIDNEASFNGLPTGNHNSPHLPDDCHAGIVFMFGPSSHTLLRGNQCEGNQGAGIAAIGDLASNGSKWNAFHWVIEQNRLVKNRWGIYLQHAELVDVAANQFVDNQLADLHVVENVVALRKHDGPNPAGRPPRATIEGPEVAKVGEMTTFDASASHDPDLRPISYRWRMQPFAAADTPQWTHTFDQPGFYRLALTVNNGQLSDLAYRDIYAVRSVQEIGTEGLPVGWDWMDDQSRCSFQADPHVKLVGEQSLRAKVDPYGGARVTLRHTLQQAIPFRGQGELSFWLKVRNENVPAWQDKNPMITLYTLTDKQLTLTPSSDVLADLPYIEAREGWIYFQLPLAGNAAWTRAGDTIDAIAAIGIGFDSWGAPPLHIWLDGMTLDLEQR